MAMDHPSSADSSVTSQMNLFAPLLWHRRPRVSSSPFVEGFDAWMAESDAEMG